MTTVQYFLLLLPFESGHLGLNVAAAYSAGRPAAGPSQRGREGQESLASLCFLLSASFSTILQGGIYDIIKDLAS